MRKPPATTRIIAIIFGTISIKRHELGHMKAITGIILGSVILALVIISILIFSAIPVLQKNSRNNMRRNDVSHILSNVVEFQSNNSGQLPSAKELATDNLSEIKAIYQSGEPTLETAIYKTGVNCDGSTSASTFSIYYMNENGKTQCQNI